MKFCTNIHDPQRMNPNDFGDPVTFTLVPPEHCHFCFLVTCFDNCWVDDDEIFSSYSRSLENKFYRLW